MSEEEKPDGYVAYVHGHCMQEIVHDSKNRGRICIYSSPELVALRFGRTIKQLENETAWRIRPVKLQFLDEE